MRVAYTFVLLFAFQSTSSIADEEVKPKFASIDIQLLEIDLKVHLEAYESISRSIMDLEMEKAVDLLGRDDDVTAERRKQLESKLDKLRPFRRFLGERARQLNRKIHDTPKVGDRDSDAR